VDTNILVYYFDGKLPGQAKPRVDAILQQSFRISIVSYIEFLSWQDFSTGKRQEAEAFLNHADLLELNRQVAERTINLRRKKRIKLGDGIIAATALVHDLTLVTRNTSDFAGIEGLNVLNPFQQQNKDS